MQRLLHDLELQGLMISYSGKKIQLCAPQNLWYVVLYDNNKLLSKK